MTGECKCCFNGFGGSGLCPQCGVYVPCEDEIRSEGQAIQAGHAERGFRGLMRNRSQPPSHYGIFRVPVSGTIRRGVSDRLPDDSTGAIE